MDYAGEVAISGRCYGVLTNVTQAPDVLVVGPIGARDLCLFPASSANLQAYHRLTGQVPEAVTFSRGDFIVSPAQGGGAGEYIVEQLPYYTPDGCVTGLFSIVGANDALPGMIAHLEALDVQYYILHCPDVPCPKYLGVMFESGQRYWSPTLSHHDLMMLFDPGLMPPEFFNSGIVVVATLPLPNAYAFASACKGLLIGQAFENYILGDHRHYVTDLVDCVWPDRCVLLNINERELALISEFLGYWPGATGDNLAEHLEAGLESLIGALPRTVVLVGLGDNGVHVGCGLASGRRRYYLPAIPGQWSFGVGAGDTALASALGTLLRRLMKKGCPLNEALDGMTCFTVEDWLALARSFVEGGFVGNSIVDAYTPLETREELIGLAKKRAEGLALCEAHSFNQVNGLRSTGAYETEMMLQERAVDREMEGVLYDTFGHI